MSIGGSGGAGNYIAPELGALPWCPAPSRKSGRPDVSPSCWVVSLNLIFLNYKMGTKPPKLKVVYKFQCSHMRARIVGTVLRTEVQAHAGRGANFPSDSLGVSWAIVLGPDPLSTFSHPHPSPKLCPNPGENQNGVSLPLPLAQVRLRLTEGCALLKVTQPSLAMPGTESNTISPSPGHFLIHFSVWDACDLGGC